VDTPRPDADFVRRVAHLARLGLDENELDGLASQLEELLGHFQALQAVDSSGVEALVHARDTRGEAAADEIIRAIDPRASILPLTEHAREGFYVVPRVLDADFGPEAGTEREGD
jgi:aspartyl-tRNA(Asn)/glutamyl-tRNA(Gln) amidotransferase subunit C